MRTSRLEAFSDGVLAIIITIMVLELKVPEDHHIHDLVRTTGLGLLSYLLSFIYVGIYWNNHHHMFHVVRRVSGGVLWANLALLLCLSLFPFTTAWVDESRLARDPVVLYGLNFLAAAIAYFILQKVIIRAEGPDSALRRALGTDFKGKASPVVYLIGIIAALTLGTAGVVIALASYVVVAIVWIVPDRRIARLVDESEQG
ncbi:TMEM175 family protein [Actinoplanes sp. NPDC049681]|uniref:TMEM175 family protein n=1 Tax=Actinoplanes sp. NPDC049681 TaxID=3363905 RepID=UPI00379C5195